MNIAKALHSLRPGANWKVAGDEITWLDETVARPTDAEISAEVARLQAEYEATEYQRLRARAYPSIVDQLDTLYHGGYDAWKEMINNVKEEFPKP